ncbi:hypothetical protein E4T56_gene18383 [Termitomyces sp. T112]|nr:hypothetical protein E4T56_gene18383 [Termitomyces sp. T112]
MTCWVGVTRLSAPRSSYGGQLWSLDGLACGVEGRQGFCYAFRRLWLSSASVLLASFNACFLGFFGDILFILACFDWYFPYFSFKYIQPVSYSRQAYQQGH